MNPYVRQVRTSDPVVIGSGVAGLTAALGLGACLVITKSGLAEGSSRWAQGGIAAAMGDEDDPKHHAGDTVAVSGGLGDPLTAELVTRAAPERIRWLLDLGARFDRNRDGTLVLGREAGHGRDRIVHANGDATGAELMGTLRSAVVADPGIEVWENTLAVDLIRSPGRVAGVLVLMPSGTLTAVLAPAVILATGGIGQVYARTTNPPEVTGDGLAMAVRAGASILDPEFVQFHPTALASDLDPMPLLTEALRGAGAKLVDREGNRFMTAAHPDAELAPRDVVARAAWETLQRGGFVGLDATHLGDELSERFPTVFSAAMEAGVDPRTTPMPTSPAAHYHMGGIAVDLDGRASLPGLYAVGETAATGLHGANRLASNSLLEGLVFGARVAAQVAASHRSEPASDLWVPEEALHTAYGSASNPVADIRQVMWDHVGVTRNGPDLAEALDRLRLLQPSTAGDPTARNLHTVGVLVATTALARSESRGAHFRTDHPESDPAWARHTRVALEPAAAIRLELVASQRGAA